MLSLTKLFEKMYAKHTTAGSIDEKPHSTHPTDTRILTSEDRGGQRRSFTSFA